MTVARAIRSSKPAIALAAALALLPAAAAGQAPGAQPLDSIAVGGSSGSVGAVSVNAAAGNNNQQANAAVIAVGGMSLGTALVVQATDNADDGRSSVKSAAIEEGAFAGSNGLLRVNMAAGSDNQQANLAVIAIGIEGRAVTDTMLSQTRASQQPMDESVESTVPEIATGIGAGAFGNSSGLVQVSLVGGERNTSANTFALTVQGSGNP